ncbi:PH domain-containing protein [Streptomyces tagetis]|uniref:PH domain-containing protein n=1 Tax=Streptomyces tagetis TaxID=2820809 RepID=A0A940XHH2_9ACTN|nr:PH domain-containing protein [Streptomyces sp. RG38]MBQ0828499.1 PH domain-containing protein [Streptomyces sp. RG38]
MTTPQHPSPPPSPDSRDRIYRSPAGVVGGVLLLALVAWLGVDAIVVGEGRTPWTALAVMLFLAPLIVAYTVRPAVFADEKRIRVRNPFRVIVLPWGRIASLRSGYTNEVVDEDGTKYQLWALPVSLRARNKAARQEARRTAGDSRGGTSGGRGAFGRRGAGVATADGPQRAESDKAVDELRQLMEAHEGAADASGGVTVRWAYEVIAPAAVGAVLLAVLLGVG